MSKEISSLSYEQARDELQEVVQQLERGEALAKHCEEWLSGARKKLDKASKERQTK